MTNYRLVLSLSLLLMACSKNDDSNTTTEIAPPPVGKKGVDFNTGSTNGSWYGNVVSLKSYWFYTWGTTLPLKNNRITQNL